MILKSMKEEDHNMIKIVRAETNRESTVMIDKRIIQDPNLSWEAKGVMAFIMTFPEGADIRTEELHNHFADRLETIHSALNELVDSGYITEESN